MKTLPSSVPCEIRRCIYNGLFEGVPLGYCLDPDTHRGNSDAVCFYSTTEDVLIMLLRSKLDSVADKLEAVLVTHKSNALLLSKTMYPGYVEVIFNDDVTKYAGEFSLCTGCEVVVDEGEVMVKL